MDYKMISKSIVLSNQFLRMSEGAQLLYYTLVMHTDGIGVVDNTDLLAKMYNAFDSRLIELIDNDYVHKINDYLYLITDWPVHNKLEKAPYLLDKTVYANELRGLKIVKNKRYIFLNDVDMVPKDNNINNGDQVGNSADDYNNKNDPDYDSKCKLLRQHNIVVESKKGKEILAKCNLHEIKKGIDFALNHIPTNCHRIDGYIISCILAKMQNQKLCPQCKGKGKIVTNQLYNDELGYTHYDEVKTDCPTCKGVGYINIDSADN